MSNYETKAIAMAALGATGYEHLLPGGRSKSAKPANRPSVDTRGFKHLVHANPQALAADKAMADRLGRALDAYASSTAEADAADAAEKRQAATAKVGRKFAAKVMRARAIADGDAQAAPLEAAPEQPVATKRSSSEFVRAVYRARRIADSST